MIKTENNSFFRTRFSKFAEPAYVPGAVFSVKKDRTNIIDLSDPGIISYKKKKNKDGTEKITIVRNHVDENDAENIEKIIYATKSNKKRYDLKRKPGTCKKDKGN